MNQAIAAAVTNTAAHPLKSTLKNLGVSQMYAAKYIGRSAMYVHARFNGFSPFTKSEEAKLKELVANVQASAAKEAANA